MFIKVQGTNFDMLVQCAGSLERLVRIISRQNISLLIPLNKLSNEFNVEDFNQENIKVLSAGIKKCKRIRGQNEYVNFLKKLNDLIVCCKVMDSEKEQ